jgi:hypothetical protein
MTNINIIPIIIIVHFILLNHDVDASDTFLTECSAAVATDFVISFAASVTGGIISGTTS